MYHRTTCRDGRERGRRRKLAGVGGASIGPNVWRRHVDQKCLKKKVPEHGRCVTRCNGRLKITISGHECSTEKSRWDQSHPWVPSPSLFSPSLICFFPFHFPLLSPSHSLTACPSPTPRWPCQRAKDVTDLLIMGKTKTFVSGNDLKMIVEFWDCS